MIMNDFYLILIFFILGLVIIGLYLIFRKIKNLSLELSQKVKEDQILLNQSIQGMHQRLDQAAQVINEVSKELGELQEMSRGMKDLQEFLLSPKLRGNIGEQVLRDLLEQYFSKDHFKIQHKFKDGQIVDAIIKTKQGIIPIDSKFPIEGFKKMLKAEKEEEKKLYLKEFLKAVKKHIDDISRKYILPQEGTVDFAVMYIPSETVYYDIVQHHEELNKYAYDRKVFMVSPNSFYYFLRILLIGLAGQRLEENARQILNTLRAIQKDAEKFGATLSILSSHLTNAKQALDRVNTEYARLSGKIENIKLLK